MNAEGVYATTTNRRRFEVWEIARSKTLVKRDKTAGNG